MIVRNIPRHFVAPLSERGGCRVIPAQIVLFVAIADNHSYIIYNELFNADCKSLYLYVSDCKSDTTPRPQNIPKDGWIAA